MESTVRAKVWLERHGNPVMGKGRAQLLQEIEETGSIRRAAEKLGISYRHAWDMVAKISEASGKQVVESHRGGKTGGNSRLTDHGRELLDIYLRAEQGRLELEMDEMRCTVTRVEAGRVTMRSERDGNEVAITVEGGSLPKKVSEGDEIVIRL